MGTEGPPPTAQQKHEADLRHQLRKGHVVFLVGAGVSIGATRAPDDASPETIRQSKTASWIGLLESGIEECSQLRPDLGPNWPVEMRQLLGAPQEVGSLLRVASEITKHLGAEAGRGDFARWLQETVGALTVHNPAVPEALARFGMPIVTTNYDSVLQRTTGRDVVTWRDNHRVERVLRGDESAIVHIHGHWTRPDTVVLSSVSYGEVTNSAHTQAILRALRALRTVVFIGFGAGLDDPNFGALLAWAREAFKESTYRHFRLVRATEREAIQRFHPPDDRIVALTYGENHEDLAPFLDRLADEIERTPRAASGSSTASIATLLSTGVGTPPAAASPAAMLNARYQVVPFLDRSKQIPSLLSWCERPDQPTVRLFFGSGGAGKTRLLLELCALLRRQGWTAGFLPSEPDLEGFRALLRSESNALVVIDYAESRPDLRPLLREVSASRRVGGAKGIHFALLARNDGAWWSTLAGADADLSDLLAEHAPTTLSGLLTDPTARTAIFREAYDAFRRALGKPAAALVSLPSLEDSRYERILYIHMAALASAHGMAFQADDLMSATLDHEERFWVRRFPTSDPLDEQEFIEQMRRAVAGFTLLGSAFTRRLASRVATSLWPEISRGERERRLFFLHCLYPGRRTRAEGEAYVAPLEPDLLGEAMVLRALQRERPDTEEYLRLVTLDASAAEIRSALELLGRVTSEEAHLPDAWFDVVLGADPARSAVPALAAAKALGKQSASTQVGDALARMLERSGTLDVAKALEREGIPDFTVALRRVATWMMTTLAVAAEGDKATRALTLYNLSVRLGDAGQLERSEATAREAVALYRDVEAERGGHGALLALALDRLCAALVKRAAYSEALTAGLEAAQRLRPLARRDADKFLPYLSRSLSNLSLAQLDSGAREEALSSAKEAVELERSLVRRNGNRSFEPLAGALVTLGNCRIALEQWAEALVSLREAEGLFRRLVTESRDGFLPDLALCLGNLGAAFDALGQPRDAAACLEEGIVIYRRLHTHSPEVFRASLADQLLNYGNVQREVRNLSAARSLLAEAIALYRDELSAASARCHKELAMALSNLAVVESETGNRDAAEKLELEAIGILRPLERETSGAYLPELARAVGNYGCTLLARGNRTAACDTLREAVALYRQLAEQADGVFQSDLARSLYNLAAATDGQEELVSLLEAVAIRRDLVRSSPGRYETDLAMSLLNLGNCHRGLGALDEALARVREAIALFEPLAESDPRRAVNLGCALLSLAPIAAAAGQLEEVVPAARRADQYLPHDHPRRPDLDRILEIIQNDLED